MMMTRTLLATAILLSLPAAAQKPPADSKATVVEAKVVQGKVASLAIDVRKLSTGLTVALVPFDSPGLAAYYTAMRVGSRDEVEPGHSGFAHLFEHMMFRGTKKLPGSKYDRQVAALGADSSAWTWNDQTVYHFVAPKAALPKVIEMEADRFQNLHYEEREFKTESGAVLGEYNKNFSNPSRQMQEDLVKLAFDKSTYKHTTMGFVEDIKAMPTRYEYSLKFFQRHYAPSKAIIVIAGDFDKEVVMRHIVEQYGSWTRPGEAVEVPEEPAQTKERRFHRSWKSPVLPQMMLGYKVPRYDNGSVDFAALTLLGEMLTGKTSPLYRKLVLEDQLAESVSFWDWPHRDPHLWLVEMRLKKPEFDAAIAELDKQLEDVIAGKTTAERLAAVKSHYRYGMLLRLRSPGVVAEQLAYYATLDGDPASLDKFLQRIDEVTLDDLKRVAAKHLVPAQRTIVTLAHEAGKEGK